MIKLILTIAIFLTLGMISIQAQETKKEHPIDKFHRECLEDENNQNTMGMSDCDMQAEEKWDKELNKVYNALMKKLKSNGKEALKTSQKAWLKFRDSEFAAIDGMFSGHDGTIWMNVRSSFTLKVVRDRVLVLEDYLEEAKNIE